VMLAGKGAECAAVFLAHPQARRIPPDDEVGLVGEGGFVQGRIGGACGVPLAFQMTVW